MLHLVSCQALTSIAGEVPCIRQGKARYLSPRFLSASRRGAGAQQPKQDARDGVFCADIIHSIILIHGLQGQPFRTWAGDTNPAGTSTEKVDFGEESSSQANSQGGRQSASKMWRFLSRTKSTERHSAAAGDERTSQPFWPSDFLPNDCSEARIMVFGYNKAITLVLCSGSPYPVVTHILNNIIGIVFMGTPHRGSPAAHVGEISRKLASFVLMDTNAWILDSLCLKNSDLERCQDAFSALWLKYNFRDVEGNSV
ncbi:hypothetical protein HYQ44_004903 [Verticillium longisporum]|nr:hypothetical protein HYQ44_004903 [Verticillium longisporum]